MRIPIMLACLTFNLFVGAAATAEPADDGTTALHWATTDALDAFAVEVTIEFGRENPCEVAAGVASAASDDFASYDVFIMEGPTGPSWSFGGSTKGFAQVHAPGIVDTRESDNDGLMSASGAGFRGTLSGLHRLTVAGMNLAPWDNDITGNASLSLDVSCGQPFHVLDSRSSRDLRLDSTWSLHGGTGASAYLVGSVNLDDAATFTTQADRARVIAAAAGTHAGRVTVDHPAGTEQWPLGAPDIDFHTLDGAAGTYRLTLDRVGVFPEIFWALMAGYDGDFDLTPGLRDERTVTF